MSSMTPAATQPHPSHPAHAPSLAPVDSGKGDVVVTNAPPDRALSTVQHAAASLGFSLIPTSPWSFRARCGDKVLGTVFGGFHAYCDFEVRVAYAPDGATLVSIERNVPWWTGAFGVRKVRRRAEELGDTVGRGLVGQQFTVLYHART